MMEKCDVFSKYDAQTGYSGSYFLMTHVIFQC